MVPTIDYRRTVGKLQHTRSFFLARIVVTTCWPLLFALWVLPATAQDAQTPTFEQQARQILHAHLKQADRLPVGALLDELARETKLPREQVQTRLSAWLDTLEVWRKQGSSEWDRMIQSGGEQTPTKAAEKFLRQFLAQARQTLEKQTDHPLEDLVDQAAKKAQIFTYQGRDLLLHLLNEPNTGPRPDRVGLLVEVHNLVKSDHGLWSSRTADGQLIYAHGRNLHEFLLPILAEELDRSPHARWALSEAKPILKPDWRLVLELKDIESERLSGQVILYDLLAQEELYRRPIQANYKYSEDLSPQKRADRFLGDIARKTREIFEEYWTTQ